MRHPWEKPEQARRLDSAAVEGYLVEHGWKAVHVYRNGIAIGYEKGDGYAIVPMDQVLGDFHTRMRETVTALAVDEDRCECEVWAELLALSEGT